MDPNANFQERITLLRATPDTFTEQDRDRFHELTVAYAEWREAGGFPADRAIRDELIRLYDHERHGRNIVKEQRP